MVKLSKKKFIEALEDTGGVITTIAKKLGVSRKSIYDYLIKFPELKEYLNDEKEKILDMAEISLFSQVKDKDFSATKYILGTLGKRRGYVEKQEIEHTTGDHYVIEVIKHEENKDRTITETDGSTGTSEG